MIVAYIGGDTLRQCAKVETPSTVLDLLRSPDLSLADFLEQQREALGVSVRQMCAGAGIQRKTYQRLLDGEAQKVDVFTILALARFLHIEDKDIVHAFETRGTHEDIERLKRARRAGFIHRNFDLRSLKRIGFIKNTTDIDYIEDRIKTYFGFDSIMQYATAPISVPRFKRSLRSVSDKMLEFWLHSVNHQFMRLDNPYEYDEERVRRILTMARALTLDETNGIRRIISELYRAGVTIVFESYLGSTKVYGGTFVIKGKPCVVVTDLYKRYSTLWHSLLHEMYHVLKDQEDIVRDGFHLSTDGPFSLFTSQLSEGFADEFASRVLCTPQMLAHLQQYINVPGMVTARAAEWNVHEKVLYGAYLSEHGTDDDWKRFGRLIALDSATVRDLVIDTVSPPRLDDVVADIRTKYHLPG